MLGEGAQLLDEGCVLFQAGVQPAEKGLFRSTLVNILVLTAQLLPGLVTFPGLLMQLVALLFLPVRGRKS